MEVHGQQGVPLLERTLKADLIGATLTKVGVPNIKIDRNDKFGPELMKHECLRSRTGGPLYRCNSLPSLYVLSRRIVSVTV